MENGIKLSTPEVCIAEYDRVVIHVWSDRPSSASWAAAARHLREVQTRFPSGISALAILPGHHAAGPTAVEDSRENLLAVGKQFFRNARACAVAVEATGFAAAAQRSALTAANLILRPSMPVKVFNSVNAAVDWLAPLASEAARPEFASALLRQALAARAEMVNPR